MYGQQFVSKYPRPNIKDVDITELLLERFEKENKDSKNESNTIALLTRSDIFPISNRNSNTIPLYAINMTSVGLFSVTPLEVNKKMVLFIKEFVKANSHKLPNKITMFDGTSCVGADIINTLYNWNQLTTTQSLPELYIIGCELDDLNFESLRENIHLFGYQDNVDIYHKNSLTFLNTYKKPLNIIYFDPPWGGINYKDKEKVDLVMKNGNKNSDNIDIFELVLQLLTRNDLELFLIILKLPYNFNIENQYYKELNNTNTVSKITKLEHKNIVYLFIEINRDIIVPKLSNKVSSNFSNKKFTKKSSIYSSITDEIDINEPKKIDKILKSIS